MLLDEEEIRMLLDEAIDRLNPVEKKAAKRELTRLEKQAAFGWKILRLSQGADLDLQEFGPAVYELCLKFTQDSQTVGTPQCPVTPSP